MAKQPVLTGFTPSGLLSAKINTHDTLEGSREVISDIITSHVALLGVDGAKHRVNLFAVLSPNQTSVTINIEYKGDRLAYLILRDDGSFEWYNLKRTIDNGKA